MADTTQRNGWSEEAKYVLRSLDELKKQHRDSEDKIELNREAFIQAINNLELTLTRDMADLKAEIKVIKTKYDARTVALSSIIPGIVGAILIIWKLLTSK